jgi:transcriptional regulator with XRE-family HTH domain
MDLTQAELGAKLRVSDQTVARWEKGETPIPGRADGMLRIPFLASGGKALAHLIEDGLARLRASLMRMVAIDALMWRSGRIGGSASAISWG